MRSTAQIKGHPVHPMLVAFPIAFFTGSFVSDLIAYWRFDGTWAILGTRLAWGGVIMALLAAVAGTIDYFTAVPPKSTGRSRAAKHGLLNVTIVILFVIAELLRGPGMVMPSLAMLALKAVGVLLLVVTGWMGGTLVYRNQIGVDHRYADAGKWRREYLGREEKGEIVATASEDLRRDQMKLIVVGDKRIVVGRTESGVVAFDDHCTHRGGSLADGVLMCGTVQCPWHGSQFDCMTGEVKAGPAKQAIRTYEAREEGGRVVVRLKPNGESAEKPNGA